MPVNLLSEKQPYAEYLNRYGVKNPDDFRHFYDYRSAFRANVTPTKWSDLPEEDKAEDLKQIEQELREPISQNAYMWPDEFKTEGHEVPAKKPRNLLAERKPRNLLSGEPLYPPESLMADLPKDYQPKYRYSDELTDPYTGQATGRTLTQEAEELEALSPERLEREQVGLETALKPRVEPESFVAPELLAEWKKRGAIGVKEAAIRLDLTENIPFNPERAVKSVSLLISAKRLKKYNEGTYKYDSDEIKENDEEKIYSYMLMKEEERIRGVTIGGQITRGVAQLPGFMIEFLATGGLAAIGKKAATKAATKTLSKIALKRAGKIAIKGVGWVGSGVARTAGMPHRVVGGFAERQLPQLGLSSEGKVLIGESAEKPFTSAWKAFGDVVIENMSEEAGATIGKGIRKVIPKKMARALTRAFKKIHPGEKVTKIMTKAGYHGFLEEWGEERLGNLMRAVTGVQDFGVKAGNMFERIIASIPNKDELLVEAGVLSVPGLVKTGIGIVRGAAKSDILREEAGFARIGKEPKAVSPGGYVKRGLKEAIEIRKEGGSLAGYNLQSQAEWLGGKRPPADSKITLYRATLTGDPINPGDYVTNDLSYAKLHIEANLGGKGKISKIEATLDDIFPADAPKEFWYAPKSIETAKPPVKPEVKGVEVVKPAKIAGEVETALHKGAKVRLPDTTNAIHVINEKGQVANILKKDFDVLKEAGPYKQAIPLQVKFDSKGRPDWKTAKILELPTKADMTAIEYAKEIKRLEKVVRATERVFAKPISPAKVTKVVKEVTGVTKPVSKITIKEEVLLKERLRTEARGARFGFLEGRRQVQEITKEKDISLADRKEAAEFFIKQNLELKDRGKFITAMRDVKTDKDLVKIVMRADLISSATERRHTLDSLKREIKRSQPSLVKGRLKKGKQIISVQAQDRLRDIIENLTSFKPGGKKQQAIEMALKFYTENPGKAMPLDLKIKVADLSKSNISEMSTAEIRQLTKDIKSIREIGRTELEAKEMRRQEQLQIKKEQLYKSIKQHSLKGKELEKPLPEKPTPLERKRGITKRVFDSLNKATAELKIPAFITEALDGYKMLGPAHRAITAPLDKATANKESILNKTNKRIAQILAPLGRKATKYLNEEFTIQGRKFTKENLWAIYANSKNEANRATLTEDWGYGFSEKLVDEAVDMLPAKDKRMVDGIMTLINESYPETVRVTQEYSGFTPKTVDNYWPIISDRELSDRALMRDVEKDLLADVGKKTSMDIGSVKQRVGHSGPPDLNFFRVLKRHVNSVAHFNTHALEVRNVQEIINDPAIKRAIENSAGEGGYNALKSSLSAVANPRRTPANWFEVKAGQLKKNATAVMLGLKVSVSLLQSGSFFQTINKVGLKDSLAGLYGYWKNPKAAHRFVYGQSSLQENRKQSFDRELRELIERDSSLKRFLTGKPGGNNLLYELIHAVDYITVMPTWLAGYKHGVRLHESNPVAYADDVVRKTQPTGRVKDLAGIMRGSEFQKWFTMFYTFFSSAYNNMALEGGKLRYRFVKEKGIGTKTLAVADFAKAYIWLLIMPALYAAIIRKPKRWRDKEYLAKSVASYALGTVPFVRDVGNVWINPQYEFTGSPVFGAGKAAKMLVSGKKLKTKIKAGVMLGGFATGFPSSQAIITTSGAIDLWEDNTDNPLRLFLSEWSLKGEKKKEKKKTISFGTLKSKYKFGTLKSRYEK